MTIETLDCFREHYCPSSGRRQDGRLRIIFRYDQCLHFSLAIADVTHLLTDNPPHSLVLSFPMEYLTDPNDLHLFSLSTSLVLQREWSDDISSIVRLMQREYVSSGGLKDDLLKRYLRIFFIYVARRAHPVSQAIQIPVETPIVQRFVLAIELDNSACM